MFNSVLCSEARKRPEICDVLLLPPFPFHGLEIVQRQQLCSQPMAALKNMPGAQPVAMAVCYRAHRNRLTTEAE